MKPPALDPAAANQPERWVEDGLRALREQAPGDESRRATLARLGLGVEPLPSDHRDARTSCVPAATASIRGALRWWLAGILLGILLVLVRRWLGR